MQHLPFVLVRFFFEASKELVWCTEARQAAKRSTTEERQRLTSADEEAEEEE